MSVSDQVAMATGRIRMLLEIFDRRVRQRPDKALDACGAARDGIDEELRLIESATGKDPCV